MTFDIILVGIVAVGCLFLSVNFIVNRMSSGMVAVVNLITNIAAFIYLMFVWIKLYLDAKKKTNHTWCKVLLFLFVMFLVLFFFNKKPVMSRI